MSREKLILAFWQYERGEKKFTKWCQKNYGIIAQEKNHQKKTFQNFFVLRSLIIYESCVGKYRLHV